MLWLSVGEKQVIDLFDTQQQLQAAGRLAAKSEVRVHGEKMGPSYTPDPPWVSHTPEARRERRRLLKLGIAKTQAEEYQQNADAVIAYLKASPGSHYTRGDIAGALGFGAAMTRKLLNKMHAKKLIQGECPAHVYCRKWVYWT